MWDEIEGDVVWITTLCVNAVLAVAGAPHLSKVNKGGPSSPPVQFLNRDTLAPSAYTHLGS